MKILVLHSIGILIFCNSLAQGNRPRAEMITQKFVLVDGHKMHYQVGGTGSPTVVFESGVTDDLNPWNPVFSEVAKFTRAVSYDRAGLGSSEPSNGARTFRKIASELHALLHNAGINPPYILVGHSMAGGTLRAFASLYGNELAGMIFLDCMNEYDILGVPKDTLTKNLPPESVTKMNTPQAAELALLRTEVLSDFPEIKSFNRLPDVPVHVFIGQKNKYPEIVNNRLEWYKRVISNQTESSVTVLPASSHYIQVDYPGLVVTAIYQMMFPNPENKLRETLREKGIDSCISMYKKMKASYAPGMITEGTLNKLGYELLQSGKPLDAIKLFSLNVTMYPNSFNVYDSLGEAYMRAGNPKDAISNYQKSLALNPRNLNAARQIEKIRGGR